MGGYVFQRFLGGDPLARIVFEHALQQVHPSYPQIEIRDALLQRLRSPVGEGHFVVLERGHPGPDLLIRRPQHPENSVELVHLGVPREKRPFGHHLGENTADRPDVDRGRVFCAPEEEFRRSVPQRHHIRGVRPDRHREDSREPEIGDFHLSWK